MKNSSFDIGAELHDYSLVFLAHLLQDCLVWAITKGANQFWIVGMVAGHYLPVIIPTGADIFFIYLILTKRRRIGKGASSK